MKIIDTGEATATAIDEYGSIGFRLAPLAQGDNTFVGTVQLAAAGSIGRHPTVRRQLFAVLEGSAIVAGSDGVETTIGVGQAALWEPGESHSTRTESGVTAIIVEGDIQTMG